MEKFRNRPKNEEYSSDTYMDIKTEVSIAEMKRDISHISESVKEIKEEVREIKNMFLLVAQAATKDEVGKVENRMEQVENRVKTINMWGRIIGTAVILAVLGAVLKLVIIQ
jgi:archaellum component FlaC